MNNQVTWFEVLGADAKKLRGFYGELFGWKFEMAPDADMDYGMTDKAQTGIGGGVGKAPQGPGWVTFYIGVDDLQGTIDRAKKLGSKLLMGPIPIPEGRVAVISDPEGHPIGLAGK
jgi:predicted enzyme related to lactoylglutathione lyase